MKRLILIPLLFLTFKIKANEEKCIAEAVYHEARGEPIEKQKQVIYVILNRKHNKNFPKNACNIINQPGQFTYKRKSIKDIKTYNNILKLVRKNKYSKSNHLYFKKCKKGNCFR